MQRADRYKEGQSLLVARKDANKLITEVLRAELQREGRFKAKLPPLLAAPEGS